MRLFVFLVCAVLFVGSLVLFGYAFDFADGDPMAFVLFGGGILGVSLSVFIPFHLMGKQS